MTAISLARNIEDGGKESGSGNSVAFALLFMVYCPVIQKTIPEIAAVFRVSSGVQCSLTCDRNTAAERPCIVRYVMLVQCGCLVSINKMPSCCGVS